MIFVPFDHIAVISAISSIPLIRVQLTVINLDVGVPGSSLAESYSLSSSPLSVESEEEEEWRLRSAATSTPTPSLCLLPFTAAACCLWLLQVWSPPPPPWSWDRWCVPQGARGSLFKPPSLPNAGCGSLLRGCCLGGVSSLLWSPLVVLSQELAHLALLLLSLWLLLGQHLIVVIVWALKVWVPPSSAQAALSRVFAVLRFVTQVLASPALHLLIVIIDLMLCAVADKESCLLTRVENVAAVWAEGDCVWKHQV